MDEEPGAENLFDHRAEMVADINDVEAAVARVAAAAVSAAVVNGVVVVGGAVYVDAAVVYVDAVVVEGVDVVFVFNAANTASAARRPERMAPWIDG